MKQQFLNNLLKSEGGLISLLLRLMKPFSAQKGGALIYIMIAIALLAALTMTFIQPGGQSSTSQNSFRLATELNSQARVIRSAIQDCILRFPQGDNAIPAAGYHHPYPLNPDSPLFTTPAAASQAEFLKCPGTGTGGDVDDEQNIFGGTMSSFLPPAPALMTANGWMYNNGAGTAFGESYDGVFFRISSDKSDPYIDEAFQKMDELFAACEADYIVGDGTNGVPVGEKSFRIWIRRIAPSC